MSSSGKGGYRGAGLDFLTSREISVGDSIVVQTDDVELTGVVLPRYESASEEYIAIKLKSGYNTGVKISKIRSISRVAAAHSETVSRTATVTENESLPRIALISTGGTIASKIDYRTGGVKAALSAADLYSSVPELAQIANVDPEVLMSEYSENLNPGHWTLMARRIGEKVRLGDYAGIVISHGTDTMHYTASALSFALKGLPVPVVLVGAQRSSDRPSSDAALNLTGAVSFASKSEVAGVFVAMHAGTSDDAIAIHIGTRVRKNHTSRRDAFESIDTTPVALVRDEKIAMQDSGFKLQSRSKNFDIEPRPSFDSRVLLLKYYPGLDFKLVEHATSAGYRAIVLEGTGLGHVNRDSFPYLKSAISSGLAIFMTSQCIWGRVRMTVYDTGRDLMDLGVVPLSDMIAETATVKAMWGLANTDGMDRFTDLMQGNLANEISEALPIG